MSVEECAHVLDYRKAMTLPQEFPYNPRPKLVAWWSGSVFAAIAVFYFESGSANHHRLLWFGVICGIFFGFIAARAFVLRRFLLLTESGLVLPTGVGRLRSKYIPYSDIRRVWQVQIVGMPVLQLATDEGKFEIVSGLISDYRTYVAIADFLHSRAQKYPAT